MNKEEKRLRKVLDSKSWNEIKTKDSWQIFKIMSEFVEGFDTMAKIALVFQFLDLLELQKIVIIIN